MAYEDDGEEREFYFHAETLVGDLRDAMLAELKDVADGKPWNERPEAQQRAVVDRVHSAARGMVNKAVLLMSNKGFASLHGELVQVQVKDGFKAVVEIPRGADFRHELVDAAGKEVVLVLASSEAFRGTRGAVPITAHAPLLDYAAEAARAADQAEAEPVFWAASEPDETNPDVSELLATHAVQFLVPFEVGRTGWTLTRFAVRVPIHDAAGELDDDEVQFFDTAEEAQAFVASATSPGEGEAGGDPVAEEQPPEGAVPLVPGTIAVSDQATHAALLEGMRRFAVISAGNDEGINWIWKDTDGKVWGHADETAARTCAARMHAAAVKAEAESASAGAVLLDHPEDYAVLVEGKPRFVVIGCGEREDGIRWIWKGADGALWGHTDEEPARAAAARMEDEAVAREAAEWEAAGTQQTKGRRRAAAG